MAKPGGASPAHGQTGPKGISVDLIKRALEANGGVILAAANALKCSSQNLRQRIKNDGELLEFQAKLEEDILDIAEGVVRKALSKGDANTARWLLDRKGKQRGYRTTTEVTGLGGGAIKHAVTSETFEASTPEEIAAARRRFIDDGND